MFENLHNLNMPKIGSPVVGALFPAIIFVIAFVAAYLLYKHFSSQK